MVESVLKIWPPVHVCVHECVRACVCGQYTVGLSEDLTVLKEEEGGWCGSTVSNRDDIHSTSL